MEIEGKTYEIIIAPDEETNSMILECWDNELDELIIYVLLNNEDGQFTFTALVEDLPMKVVEEVIRLAKTRLLPSLDI